MEDAEVEGNATGAAERAALTVMGGLSNISIDSSADLDRLLRARFKGEQPKVDVNGNDITIRSQRGALDSLLALIGRRPKPRGEITLNTSPAWELSFLGGISNITASVGDLRLRSLDIIGGVRNVEIHLPSPSGAVRLEITGGVSGVQLHRPAGVPLSVNARGGAVGLRIDDERFRAVAGSFTWQSSGFSPDADHYALNVMGGVSGLTIDSR